MPNKRSYDSCDKTAGTNLGPSEAEYLVTEEVGEDLYFIYGIGSLLCEGHEGPVQGPPAAPGVLVRAAAGRSGA